MRYGLPAHLPEGWRATIGYAIRTRPWGGCHRARFAVLGDESLAALALPEDHPFWRAQEKPFLPGMPTFLERHARLLLCLAPDGSHVQAFAAGNHGEGHAHDDAKYEKFCYSTAFAFSVPKSSTLLNRGAFDSMLAFSETGRHWHGRYGMERFSLLEDRVVFTWNPYPGVRVETTLLPAGEWHIRVHRIQSGRELLAAEGGYAIRREEGGETPDLFTDRAPQCSRSLGPQWIIARRVRTGRRYWRPSPTRTCSAAYSDPHPARQIPAKVAGLRGAWARTAVINGQPAPGMFARAMKGAEE